MVYRLCAKNITHAVAPITTIFGWEDITLLATPIESQGSSWHTEETERNDGAKTVGCDTGISY